MPAWTAGEVTAGPGLAKVVILDTETTGLDAGKDKLIEVGMISRLVDTATGAFVGDAKTQCWLEDPGFPLEQHTIDLTGITDAELLGKSFDEEAICNELADAALVIAHGSWHDRAFMEARFSRLPPRPWGCSLEHIDWRAAGFGSSKLDYLLFRLGMFHDGHRAVADCQALGHVLGASLPDGLSALQHVVNRSLEKDFKIHANGAPFEAKDLLKARGYYWDGDQKVWHCTVAESDLDAEFEWLKSDVYQGRPARVRLAIISAHGRFTRTPPEGSIEEQIRSIGAQGDGSSVPSGRAARFASSVARRY